MIYLKKLKAIIFLLYLLFVIFSCAYTKSGNQNWNRDISIKVISGNIYINISGYISEDIYIIHPINDVDDKYRFTPKDN
ncbi:hypothetical protein, partial [Treponema sp. R6D11]